MTRTITRSEFQNAAGEAVYVSHVHYMSRAEQVAGDAACQAVVVPAAFVPALSAGPAFDSMEAPSNCEGFAHAGEALAHAQHEAAVDGDDCTNGVCLMTRGSD